MFVNKDYWHAVTFMQAHTASSATAATTEDQRLGGLAEDTHCLGSGGRRAKTKLSARTVSPEASLLGLWVAVFSLCLHGAFPLNMSVS